MMRSKALFIATLLVFNTTAHAEEFSKKEVTQAVHCLAWAGGANLDKWHKTFLTYTNRAEEEGKLSVEYLIEQIAIARKQVTEQGASPRDLAIKNCKNKYKNYSEQISDGLL